MKMEIVFWKSLKWYIRKVISSLSMVVYRDSVISYRLEKIHNPQESGLDRMLRFMLY